MYGGAPSHVSDDAHSPVGCGSGGLGLCNGPDRLSGAPAAADVGQYVNIDINVSDGQASARLGRFSEEVTPPLGRVNLTWRPPVAHSDGTPLVDLAAYIVYHVRSPARLDRFVAVEDPRATGYTVAGLESGTWYFAVTAYSAAGVESDRSETVSKAVTAV